MKRICFSLAFILLNVCAFAQINLSVVPSRTTGVAPLAVNFDVTGTTGLSDGNDYVLANFVWDFDVNDTDPNGKWEETRGFFVAHVFEEPGTYTVNVHVTDSEGNTASESITITVTAFSGTTYYVAASGNDGNSGTSTGSPLKTISEAISRVSSGGRILLKNGDAFTQSSQIKLNNDNVTLGTYGTGEKAIINYTETETAIDISNSNCRFMDFYLKVPNVTFNSIEMDGSDNLLYNIELSGVVHGKFASASGTDNIVWNCYAHDFGDYGIYCPSFEKLSIIGFKIRNLEGASEHGIRTANGSKIYVSNCDFETRIAKTAMAFRSNEDLPYTNHIVCVNNKTDRVIQGGEVNNSTCGPVSYCLVEGNYVTRHHQENYSYNPFFTGFEFSWQSNYVIRNNIIDCKSRAIVLKSHTRISAIHDIYVYNNTMINIDNPQIVVGCYGIDITSASTNINVKNNLYVANHSNSSMFLNDEYTSMSNNIHYNTDNTSSYDNDPSTGVLHVNPQLVSTDEYNAAFVTLSSGSPAINAGASVPVFYDFNGSVRDGAIDIGAFEYGGGVADYIIVSPSELDFETAGGSATINVSANVSWTASDNQSWLSLGTTSGTNDGTISVTATEYTGTGSRTGTITITDGTITKTVAVTQVGYIAVTGVDVSPSSLQLYVNATQQVVASVVPGDATNQNVTWSSSNTSVATVSSAGIVTAVGEGSANITATTEEGSFTGVCALTVTEITGTAIDFDIQNITDYTTGSMSGTATPNNTELALAGNIWKKIDFPYTITANTVLSFDVNASDVGEILAIGFDDDDDQNNSTYLFQVAGSQWGDWDGVITDYVYSGSGTQSFVINVGDYYTGAMNYMVFVLDDDADASGDAVFNNVIITEGGSTVSVTGVSLDQSNLTLDEGTTDQLTATVSPANASDQSVTWSSSNTSVATVSASGLVTAIAEGSATVTVTTTDGGYTALCVVTVNSSGNGEAVEIIMDNTGSGVTFTGSTWDATSGSNYYGTNFRVLLNGTTSTIRWTPDLTNVEGAFEIFVWYATDWSWLGTDAPYTVSHNGGTTTVDVDQTQNGGQWVSIGTFTLSAGAYVELSGDLSNSMRGCGDAVRFYREGGTTINVTSVSLDQSTLTLETGATGQLTETVSPANATDASVSWSSSNTSVATVDANGLVSAVAAGSATITVTTTDGGYTATCTVTVNNPTSVYPYDIIAVSSSESGSTPELSLDGDFDAGWSTDVLGATLLFELSEEKYLTSVDIVFKNQNDRAYNLTIETSTDGTNWTTVYNGQTNPITALDWYAIDVTDSYATYVRITGNGNSENDWTVYREVALNYDTAPVYYILNVNGGSGDGSYEAGNVVSITADDPADGYQFDAWTGDVANIADVSSSSTTITMPASAASITATYSIAQQVGIIMDNTDSGVTFTGSTWEATSASNIYGTNYRVIANGSGNTIRWTPDLSGIEGTYSISVWYGTGWTHLGTDAPYTITHDAGTTVIDVDQTQDGGQWVLLGSFDLSNGDYVELSGDLSNDKRGCGDAVKFESTALKSAYLSDIAHESISEVNIYPNPLDKQTELIVEGVTTGSLVQISNMAGSVVYNSGRLQSNEPLRLNNNFKHGIYVVSIISNDNIKNFKLFVK